MAKVWSWQLGENREVPRPVAPPPPPVDGDLEPAAAPADVTPPGAAPVAPAKIPDEWWERLVKGVPVEAIGGYTALMTFLRVPQTVPPLAFGFGVGLVLTYLAMTMLRGIKWNNADAHLQRVGRIQILLALAAFTVWAYAQGGVFAAWMPTFGTGADIKVYDLYEDWVAGAATVIMGLVLSFSNKLTGEAA